MPRTSVVVLTLFALLAVPAAADDGNGIGSAFFTSNPLVIGGTLNVTWGSPGGAGLQSLFLISDSAGPSMHPAVPYPLCIDIFSPGFGIISSPILDVNGEGSFSASVPNVPGLVGFAPVYATAIIVDFSLPAPFLSIPKTMRLSFENPDSSSPTGALSGARALHTATALGEGVSNAQKVLVAGGGSGTILAPVATDTTEIFDPLTNSFTAGPVMAAERALHTATLLLDGRILIVGGTDTLGTVTTVVEVYDPATNVFTAVAPLPGPRAGHMATRLASGNVLVTGGVTTFAGGTTSLAGVLNTAVNTGVVYNPVTDSWTPVSNLMSSARFAHGQCVLGGVAGADAMIAGGINGGITFFGQDVPTYTSTVDLYDEVTNAFSPTGNFASARAGMGLSQLGSGDVLLTGGIVAGLLQIPTATSNCQLWNGASWSPTGSLSSGRGLHGQVTTGAGDALLTAGLTGTFLAIGATADVGRHDGTSYTASAPLGTNPGIPGSTASPRGSHTTTLLCDGTYLIAGGADASTGLPTCFRLNL